MSCQYVHELCNIGFPAETLQGFFKERKRNGSLRWSYIVSCWWRECNSTFVSNRLRNWGSHSGSMDS
ncbi:hypothetical protein FCV25MIE_11681 [Fagus crenata]